MKSLIAVSAFLCAFLTYSEPVLAKTADAFHKRFQIVRTADGKLVGIRDRTLPVKFSVKPYINLVKEQLLHEQSLLLAKGFDSDDYDRSIYQLLNEDRDYSFSGDQDDYDQNVKNVANSLKKLALLNVNGIFSNQLFNEVVNQYESKLSDAILILDPTMIANVNDSSYFFKKNMTYKAVTWGLDFARKRLSNLPILNTVSYVIVQSEKLINERRQFHQNMLLHYLENFNEADLGLSHDEVNLIWSSIYESRIPWFAIWESNNAKNNWQNYGVNNFYLNFRQATASLRSSQNLYSEVGDRLNFAFQTVTFNNEKVIVNLVNKENIFQSRPAVAFNYDKPTQIVRKRVLLSLAGLGVSFLPFSSAIKDRVDSFIKSFYEQHKITEGALYGYFESNGDASAKKRVESQYLNPFDNLAI